MKSESSQYTRRYLPLAFLLALNCQTAKAVHLDVEIWGDGDAMNAGFCRTPGAVGCDLTQLIDSLSLPANTLPMEGETGKMIFLADFRDFSGGPNKTSNPGFQAVQNALNPGELVRYRALGGLKHWNTSTRNWAPAPDNVRIKLAGAIDPSVVITDPSQCGGQLFCFGQGNLDGVTLFTGNGITGLTEMIIDAANSQGSLHTHLNFFLENTSGILGGPVGAYLLEMQVLSTQRHQESESFYVMFNAGLSTADFSDALMDRVDTLPAPPPAPVAPVADAGNDRVVRLNSTIVMDASASYDPQPGPSSLSFTWQQTLGPTVTLLGANTATPSFAALQPGNYTFKLTASDGAAAGYDEVTYTAGAVGDVDLDGDIDRIDIALILAAASKNPVASANDVRDLDGNGTISGNDALLAKARCTLRLCYPTHR